MPAKVGFILKGYPRLSETFIAQEIHLLEERGLELEIYSMRAPREEARHPVHGKIRASVTYLPETVQLKHLGAVLAAVVRFPASFAGAFVHAAARSAARRKKSPLKRLWQAAWLIRHRGLASGHSVEHLHSHFAHTPTELAFYLARITGLTYSISAHAKDIYTSTPEELRERVQSARFLMTCTKFNAERLAEIVGPAHAPKVHEVYHGVNLASFAPVRAERRDFPPRRLLTVARLVEKKGSNDVLRAIAMLKANGLLLPYDIYGAGELRAKVQAWIAELGLSGQGTLHGSVTQPGVLEAYRRGGVFVLGSFETASGDRDVIPKSMAEAMSMELPVVATKVSGIPELVEHDRTGLLCEPRSPEALAAAIQRLYAEPGLAARLGEAARAKVARVFDAHRCIDRCEELLAPYAKGRR